MALNSSLVSIVMPLAYKPVMEGNYMSFVFISSGLVY
jgi:hypothetical protein